MEKVIIGHFSTYAQASEVVRNLALGGIDGTEVESVTPTITSEVPSARDALAGMVQEHASPKELDTSFIPSGLSNVQHRAMVIVKSTDRNAEHVTEVLRQRTEEVKQTFCVIRRLDGLYLKDMKKGTRTDNILDAVRFPSQDLQELKATVSDALQKVTKVSPSNGGDFCILMVDASFSLSPTGLEPPESA